MQVTPLEWNFTVSVCAQTLENMNTIFSVGNNGPEEGTVEQLYGGYSIRWVVAESAVRFVDTKSYAAIELHVPDIFLRVALPLIPCKELLNTVFLDSIRTNEL